MSFHTSIIPRTVAASLGFVFLTGFCFLSGCDRQRVDNSYSADLAVAYFQVVDDATGEPIKVSVTVYGVPFSIYNSKKSIYFVAIGLTSDEPDPKIILNRDGYDPYILDKEFIGRGFLGEMGGPTEPVNVARLVRSDEGKENTASDSTAPDRDGS